ncbi:MAG: helix-turn-helix domain-containing protein [Pseudomonadota bacterium]
MLPITVTNDEECAQCPIRTLIVPLTGKWRPLILFSLEDGSQRFSEIRRLIGDITQRVLTENLRQLERDGYLTRQVIERRTIEVHYEITSRGLDAVSYLKPLVDWAAGNLKEVKESREEYDARERY